MHKIPVQDAYHRVLNFNPSINLPIRCGDSTRFLREPISAFDHLARITGSTRALPVSDKQITDKKDIQRTHADAVCASYTCREARIDSLVMAISTGNRGTATEIKPDRIAEASKFTAQLAVSKFCSLHIPTYKDDTNELKKAIAKITEEMKLETSAREHEFAGAQANVTIMVIYYDNEAAQFNYIGISIGGCVIGAYDPEKDSVTTLINACNPVNSTVTVANHELYDIYFDQGKISENSIVLAMSEGAYQFLTDVVNIERQIPVRTLHADQADENDSNNVKQTPYRQYTLNESMLTRALITRDNDDAVDLFAEQLLLQVCGEAERKRKEVAEKLRAQPNPENIHPDDFKIGGDLTLLATRISRNAFEKAYLYYAVPQLETEADSKIAKATSHYEAYKNKEDINDFTAADTLFKEANLCFRQARNVAGQMACIMGLGWLHYERSLHLTGAELLANSMSHVRPSSPLISVNAASSETIKLQHRAKCILFTIQLIELFDAQPNHDYLNRFADKRVKLNFLTDLSNYVIKRAGADIATFLLYQNDLPDELQNLTFKGNATTLSDLSRIRTKFDIDVAQMLTDAKQQQLRPLTHSY